MGLTFTNTLIVSKKYALGHVNIKRVPNPSISNCKPLSSSKESGFHQIWRKSSHCTDSHKCS